MKEMVTQPICLRLAFKNLNLNGSLTSTIHHSLNLTEFRTSVDHKAYLSSIASAQPLQLFYSPFAVYPLQRLLSPFGLAPGAHLFRNLNIRRSSSYIFPRLHRKHCVGVSILSTENEGQIL